ncbi:hypothetical protein DV735_g3913, partial [Chaetothyriales sp. CBS 134920]
MNPSRRGLRLLHRCCSHAHAANAATPSIRAAPTTIRYISHDAKKAETSSVSSSSASTPARAEMGVGEIEGATFRVEPLRRSRKRGILESDLLLSTFADANLGSLSRAQLEQYDLFLDENDWDIYYWATQSPADAPEAADPPQQQQTQTQTQTQQVATSAQGVGPSTDTEQESRSGEWAQTVGTFKPAYRPVPARWKDSEILSLLRKHVRERSAGGVLEDVKDVEAGSKGTGLGRMPEVRVFDS